MPTQTFTSSGTWSCPSNYLGGSLIVQAWGEGGNGANGLANGHSGGGGGGGEFAQDSPGVTAGNNYTVTVGAGGTGTDTSFVGDSQTVTAHHGGNGSGITGGSAGTGSTSATHFDGGGGGAGHTGTGNQGGGGGGGSAGSGGTGGAGGAGTSTVGGSAGTAGSGSPGGAAGGAGSPPTGSPSSGNTPGGAGGGGRSTSSISGSGAGGAAGQVILTWSTFTPAPPPTQRRITSAAPLRHSLIRSTVAFIPPPAFVNTEAIRYPQHIVAELIRHERYVAQTGWPVPVQPPELPYSVHRWSRPLYPRRGVTETQFSSRNVPPTESYRAHFKPIYPRRGVVSSTGWPVPVQPASVPNVTAHPHDRIRKRKPARGSSEWPGTVPLAVQPPWSSWQRVRRWTKPLLPRKGVVPPEAFAPPPIVYAYNPVAIRRIQRYQWFRRANVGPTGWPVLVQPPTASQWLRRWIRPLLPRKGEVPVYALPPEPPVPVWYRARFKPPYPRRGNPQPNSGLPVPVQPSELPRSVKRISRIRLYRYSRPAQSSAEFFVPVQPPWSSWHSLRRSSRPLWPRRARTNIATFPGAPVVAGYQVLPIQTFTYTPGGPGVDLTTLNLVLFPLNKLGYTFWNPYGDVIFVVLNNTPLAVAVTPNVIRTVERQTIELPQYTLQPGVMQAFGPYPPNDFSSPNLATPLVSYYMTINVEANYSGVYAGAFRLVPAPPIGHTGKYDLLGAKMRKRIAAFEAKLSATPGEIHPGETTPGA